MAWRSNTPHLCWVKDIICNKTCFDNVPNSKYQNVLKTLLVLAEDERTFVGCCEFLSIGAICLNWNLDKVFWKLPNVCIRILDSRIYNVCACFVHTSVYQLPEVFVTGFTRVFDNNNHSSCWCDMWGHSFAYLFLIYPGVQRTVGNKTKKKKPY